MSTDNKLHYFMVAADVVYSRKDKNDVATTKKKTLNCVVTHNKKLITFSLMEEARKAILQRCFEELNIEVTDVADFIFLNWVYMGVMSDAEFNDHKQHTGVKKIKANPYDS